MSFLEKVSAVREVIRNRTHIRALHVEPFGERTNDKVSIKSEMLRFGISKEVKDDQTSLTVGVTLCAAPHTPLTSEKDAFIRSVSKCAKVHDEQVRSYIESLNAQAKRIPLHFVHWWIPEEKSIPQNGVFRFAELDALSPSLQANVFSALSDHLQITVRTLYESLSSEQKLPSVQPQENGVLIYGVFGHHPKIEREKTNQPRGPQSHPSPHFHVAALTPELLKEHINDGHLSTDVIDKVISKQNILIAHLIAPLVEEHVHAKYTDWTVEELVSIKAPTPQRGETKSDDVLVSTYAGFVLKPKDESSVDAKDALKVLTNTIAAFQEVFDQSRLFYERRNSGESTQAEALLQFTRALEKLGYNDQAAISSLARFISKLRSVQDGVNGHAFVFPGDLSGGYSFDYTLSENGLQISAIHIAPRISEKNVFEDKVGLALMR